MHYLTTCYIKSGTVSQRRRLFDKEAEAADDTTINKEMPFLKQESWHICVCLSLEAASK